MTSLVWCVDTATNTKIGEFKAANDQTKATAVITAVNACVTTMPSTTGYTSALSTNTDNQAMIKEAFAYGTKKLWDDGTPVKGTNTEMKDLNTFGTKAGFGNLECILNHTGAATNSTPCTVLKGTLTEMMRGIDFVYNYRKAMATAKCNATAIAAADCEKDWRFLDAIATKMNTKEYFNSLTDATRTTFRTDENKLIVAARVPSIATGKLGATCKQTGTAPDLKRPTCDTDLCCAGVNKKDKAEGFTSNDQERCVTKKDLKTFKAVTTAATAVADATTMYVTYTAAVETEMNAICIEGARAMVAGSIAALSAAYLMA